MRWRIAGSVCTAMLAEAIVEEYVTVVMPYSSRKASFLAHA